MALSLYDPKKKVFVTYTTPNDGDMATTDMLLVNVLIELKICAHYLQLLAQPTDEIISIRADVVGV